MTDEVQIIPDPSIPEFPPCIVVEERPPSSCQIVEEHPSSPKPTKKKDNVFVSTLPRRRTRSARSTAAAVGWKDMEHAIPILHPLPSITTETATQEPVPSDDMVVTQEPAAQEETVQQDTAIPNLAVTQEPTIQAKTIPQELVRPESTVAPEQVLGVSATQEPVTQTCEDVPLAQLFSQIEKKIQDTTNSRITELLKENDSLKAELASLRDELQVARQNNPEGIALDILSLRKVVMDQHRELMCSECGNIYFEAGYKIVKVPVTGQPEEPVNLSVKTEFDLTAPQEPVRKRRSLRNRVVVGSPAAQTQEPLLHSVLKDKASRTNF
jgi:hypothetical protein